MRFLRTAVLVLAVALVSGGCWDRREIEERSTVLVLGIDAVEAPSADPHTLTLSAQIAIPGAIPLGGSSESGRDNSKTVHVISAAGHSVRDALSNMQKRLNQRIFFGHTRIIAISEELARSGIGPYLDAIRRNPEIRRLLWLVVVRGKARDLVAFDPPLEQVPAFYLMNMFDNDVRMGRMGNVLLGEFLIRTSNDGEDGVLPFVEVHDDDIERLGIAVFQGDKMVGSLPVDQEWTKLQIRGVQTAAEEVRVEIPEGFVTAGIFARRREMTPKVEDGKLTIKLRLMLEANVTEAFGAIDFHNSRVLDQVAQALGKQVSENTMKVIAKTQNWNADIFGFGEQIRAFYPKLWNSLDWRQVYPQLTFEIETKVLMRRIGMALGSK